MPGPAGAYGAVCTSMNLRNCWNLQKSLFAKNWDPQKFSTTRQNMEVHMYINSLIQCDVLFHSTSLLAGTTHSGFGMLAALKVSQQSTNDISPRCYTKSPPLCRTCAWHALASTRPHQLGRGDWEIGTAAFPGLLPIVHFLITGVLKWSKTGQWEARSGNKARDCYIGLKT